MINFIVTGLTQFIIHTISVLGYPGVGLLMAIESAAIPLPSEVIMPFAGFLVYSGQFTLLGVAFWGGVGSVVGSLITYAVGRYGGRPFVKKYGRYVFVSEHDLDLADRFFKRFGNTSTFIGRLLPVVRSFISVPAGISRVPLLGFTIYSFVGSFIWSYILAFLGMKLGPEWVALRERFHWFDTVVIVLLAIGIIWWIARHIRHR